MDDLAFDMYLDPDVAQVIRKLERKKQDAVTREYLVECSTWLKHQKTNKQANERTNNLARKHACKQTRKHTNEQQHFVFKSDSYKN